ncbi:MFS transporter [Paraburkholderia sp. EG285A]|uniref:MFS transporter n=1 Tax=Paraburkholderia sp. EG285A TaxID=3237009 RepID=UPI0034D1CFC1
MPRPPNSPTDHTLLSLMVCVFAVFLVTGAALPALPLHIHGDLGFGTFAVGLVSGAQFGAALLCRLWSGTVSGRRGPKFAVTTGLAALAGTLYLVSLLALGRPLLSIAILIAGRVLLGGAESFVMIGAQSWFLSLGGGGNVGKMIAWIGTAMFMALALGAPLGSALLVHFGFASIGRATLIGAVGTWLLVVSIPAIHRAPQSRKATGHVLKAVWIPSLAMAFSSVGYGVMTAFGVLLFVEHGAVLYRLRRGADDGTGVLRPIAGPPRGARTAMVFVVIQSVGMALIWLSPYAWLALAGSAMAGFGYALVYSGLGIEAVARAPAEARGLAMGVYTAFIDLALGLLAPLLGLLANGIGLSRIFLVTALLALCTLPIAA